MMTALHLAPYLWGFGVLIALWLIYSVATGNFNPWQIIQGFDGRPSTSKLQFFLWTAILIFAYVAIFVARVIVKFDHTNKPPWDPLWDNWDKLLGINLTANLLTAMGLSAATMVAAKGITTSYVNNGQLTKPSVTSTTDEVTKPPNCPDSAPAKVSGGIFTDDCGMIDLSKIQLMSWTLIAIGIYIFHLIQNINSPINTNIPPNLPDIDGTLMVLMGLGQGAYIGKKIVTTDPTSTTTSATTNPAPMPVPQPPSMPTLTPTPIRPAGPLPISNPSPAPSTPAMPAPPDNPAPPIVPAPNNPGSAGGPNPV